MAEFDLNVTDSKSLYYLNQAIKEKYYPNAGAFAALSTALTLQVLVKQNEEIIKLLRTIERNTSR